MSDYRNHTPSTIHPDTRTEAEKASALMQAEADLDARFTGAAFELHTHLTHPAGVEGIITEVKWQNATPDFRAQWVYTASWGTTYPAHEIKRMVVCPIHGAGCEAWA